MVTGFGNFVENADMIPEKNPLPGQNPHFPATKIDKRPAATAAGPKTHATTSVSIMVFSWIGSKVNFSAIESMSMVSTALPWGNFP